MKSADPDRRYDPGTGRWAEMAPMPTARYGLVCGVAGGQVGEPFRLAEWDCFPAKFELECTRACADTEPLSVCLRRNRQLYAIAGGCRDLSGRIEALATVERYDPGANPRTTP